MKTTVEKRKPNGPLDYLALALTTFGVGYIPGAPGTYGSVVGIAIYFGLVYLQALVAPGYPGVLFLALLFGSFIVVGVWAASRSVELLGNTDPSQAVVDEVMGQIVTLAIIPLGAPWPFILAGFVLFRFFDIIKPYPCRKLESIPGGFGICADDLVAGLYAGLCLNIGYRLTIGT